MQDNVNGKSRLFLKHKAGLITWKEEVEHLFMIARSFSSVGDEKNVLFMDLDMLEKLVYS